MFKRYQEICHLFLIGLSLVIIFPLLSVDRGPHHSAIILEDPELILQAFEDLRAIYYGANIWCKLFTLQIKPHSPTGFKGCSLFAPKISFNSICGGCGISMFSKPEKLGKLSNCPKSGNPAKTFSKDVGWRRMTGCDDSSPD